MLIDRVDISYHHVDSIDTDCDGYDDDVTYHDHDDGDDTDDVERIGNNRTGNKL